MDLALENQKSMMLYWRIFHSFEECQRIMKQLNTDEKDDKEQPTASLFVLPYQWIIKLAAEKPARVVFGMAGMESVKKNSFTESVAGNLVKGTGAEFVLLGTSHARHLLKEGNEEIQEQIRRAIQVDLVPFLCVGETYQELKEEKSAEILTRQIEECLNQLSDEEIKRIQFIYEAPWLNQYPFIPALETIKHGYQRAAELIQSLIGSRLAKQVPLLCPVPDDVEDFQEFAQTIPAPGYFVSGPSFAIEGSSSAGDSS